MLISVVGVVNENNTLLSSFLERVTSLEKRGKLKREVRLRMWAIPVLLNERYVLSKRGYLRVGVV